MPTSEHSELPCADSSSSFVYIDEGANLTEEEWVTLGRQTWTGTVHAIQTTRHPSLFTFCTAENPNREAMVHLTWEWEPVSINQPHPTKVGWLIHTRRCKHCGLEMQDEYPYYIFGYIDDPAAGFVHVASTEDVEAAIDQE